MVEEELAPILVTCQDDYDAIAAIYPFTEQPGKDKG
jgi:hypothetical protein